MCFAKNNLDSLSVICNSSKKLRSAIIASSDKNVILAICECILNVLNGNVKIDNDVLKKCKKYQHHLRTLVSPHTSVKRKKSILEQKGSGIWMSLLLPPIVEFASKLFNQKNGNS